MCRAQTIPHVEQLPTYAAQAPQGGEQVQRCRSRLESLLTAYTGNGSVARSGVRCALTGRALPPRPGATGTAAAAAIGTGTATAPNTRTTTAQRRAAPDTLSA